MTNDALREAATRVLGSCYVFENYNFWMVKREKQEDFNAAMQDLRAALDDDGWEEVTAHTFQSDDDDPEVPCPICDALGVIERKWPGAQVWRRKEK